MERTGEEVEMPAVWIGEVNPRVNYVLVGRVFPHGATHDKSLGVRVNIPVEKVRFQVLAE